MRGDTVTFSYTAPDDSPLQDAIGNDAGNLSNEAVIDGAVVAPGAPAGLFAFGTRNTSVLVDWAAPGDTGGAPITGYEYRFAPGSTVLEATPWKQRIASGFLFLDEHDGVRSGTTYVFEVRRGEPDRGGRDGQHDRVYVRGHGPPGDGQRLDHRHGAGARDADGDAEQHRGRQTT